MSPLLRLLHHVLPVPGPSTASCWASLGPANPKWLYMRFISLAAGMQSSLISPCCASKPGIPGNLWLRPGLWNASRPFHSLVNDHQTADLNYSLNRYDMVVVDEASLVSPKSFSIVAATLNRLNCRPVVVIAGDKKQQQPLQTVDSRVFTMRSILNDNTFGEKNPVKHALYQQFRVLDRDYGTFLDLLWYLQPTQELDKFQQSLDVSFWSTGWRHVWGLQQHQWHCNYDCLEGRSAQGEQHGGEQVVIWPSTPNAGGLCFCCCRPRCISMPWHEDCHNWKPWQGLESGEWAGCHPGIQPE